MVVHLLEALRQARKCGSISDGGPSSHKMAPGPTQPLKRNEYQGCLLGVKAAGA